MAHTDISHRPLRRTRLALGLVLFSTLGVHAGRGADLALDSESSERRLYDSARYLASDELEGRGIGTKGLDMAADYISARFKEMGLKTDLYGDGTPFNRFTMTTGVSLGERNELVLVGPAPNDGSSAPRVELKLNEGFTPLSLGSSGVLDVPVVFAGYGITAKDENYDDFADFNVTGKAVILMRHEPQQDNPQSAFNGADHSPYAPLMRKVSNAYEHGAAAVIFCTDDFEIRKKVESAQAMVQVAVDELTQAQAKFKEIEKPNREQLEAHLAALIPILDKIRAATDAVRAEYDPLLNLFAGGTDESSKLPVVHCRRSVLDQALRACLNTDLATLERQIDEGPQPKSCDLPGWRLTGEVSVVRNEVEVKNVLGILPGEGPLAEETIVIGAHYDHLGFGGDGSLAPGVKDVHNGADDNGSGTCSLIEVAQRLASRPKKLPRTILFIAFTGEERGLVGSGKYCANPLIPMEKTIAMLNMDMVGRLTDNKLIIQGVDTAKQFEHMILAVNQREAFEVTKQPGGFGPSDHSSFYAHKVPVMHFFTGTHPDYHRPSDDYDKLNLQGMRRVCEMVADVAVTLAEADSRPEYLESHGSMVAGGGGDRPYFGSIPDLAFGGTGYALSGVTKNGPAEKAGIKGGDVVIQFGDSKIGSLADFDSALRKFKAGDKVPVVVQRGNEEVKLEVVLEPPK